MHREKQWLSLKSQNEIELVLAALRKKAKGDMKILECSLWTSKKLSSFYTQQFLINFINWFCDCVSID